MFYSHEVLTSREYGVATVWLIATLGAKSALKKVNRKTILEVDVPKACETIVSPKAPMALRLQSNLLYGVTRVYGEQCSYVLNDAQNAQNNMRALFKAIKSVGLEGKHKARPEQINLNENTQFMLEDLLMFDVDSSREFDLTSCIASDLDSLLSPHLSVSSGPGSEHADPNMCNILIPSSRSSSVMGAGGFGLAGSARSTSGGRGSRFGSSMFRREEDERLFDPGFAFDDMGNIVDSVPDVAGEAMIQSDRPSLRDPTVLNDVSGVDVDMHDAHDNAKYQTDDATFVLPQDDIDVYADAEAFPTRLHSVSEPRDSPARHASASAQPSEQAEPTSDDITEEAATAPAVRSRKKKGIVPDTVQELHNHDLSAWSNNYLTQMHEISRGKVQARSTALAKKNADFWILQNGIGGLGMTLGQEAIPEPLRLFTGNALIEALTGPRSTTAGDKHAREDDGEVVEDDVGIDGRRVRSRSDQAEACQGDDTAMYNPGHMADEFEIGLGADTANEPRDETIEVGREAQTPLAEHPSSIMPWNNTASIRGSSARAVGRLPFLAGGMATSSVVGGEPFDGLGRAVSNLSSRVPSASPSRGRGDVYGIFESPGDHRVDDGIPHDDHSDKDDDQSTKPIGGLKEQFETFGPAALVTTQQTNRSAWVNQALDSQSINFFTFVQAGIQEADNVRSLEQGHLEVDSGGQQDPHTGTILFEALLPPLENSCIVASQGLLHVLALATKNLLRARQDMSFGSIQLRVPDLSIAPEVNLSAGSQA